MTSWFTGYGSYYRGAVRVGDVFLEGAKEADNKVIVNTDTINSGGTVVQGIRVQNQNSLTPLDLNDIDMKEIGLHNISEGDNMATGVKDILLLRNDLVVDDMGKGGKGWYSTGSGIDNRIVMYVVDVNIFTQQTMYIDIDNYLLRGLEN